MFSRTTIASSIRMPIASESPSSDIVFSVKPKIQSGTNDASARHRQREAGDDGRAPRVEEEEHDEHGEQRALDERAPARPRPSAARARPASRTISIVVPAGSVRLEPRQPRLHAVGDLRRAVALRLHDVEADRLAPVVHAPPSGAPPCPPRTVATSPRRMGTPLRCATVSCGEVLRARRAGPRAGSTRSVSGPVRLPTGAARFCARSAPTTWSTPTPDAASRAGVEDDVERRAVGAGDVHLRDAGHRAQVAADRLVGQLGELRRRERRRRERERRRSAATTDRTAG